MAGRFSTIAVLKLFECATDGRDVEAIVPALREASPDVVITPPASPAYVANHFSWDTRSHLRDLLGLRDSRHR